MHCFRRASSLIGPAVVKRVLCSRATAIPSMPPCPLGPAAQLGTLVSRAASFLCLPFFSTLVVPSCGIPSTGYVLGLFFVDPRHGIARSGLSMEQFVELGLNGLSVTMFSALDQEGHEPNSHGRHAVPIERIAIMKEPSKAERRDDHKGQRMSCEYAKLRKRTTDCIDHWYGLQGKIKCLSSGLLEQLVALAIGFTPLRRLHIDPARVAG